MTELFEQDRKTADRQSSKGNQLKWYNGNTWYKADYTGYEGMAEYMVSHLLILSDLEKSDVCIYDTEKIEYKKNPAVSVKEVFVFIPKNRVTEFV